MSETFRQVWPESRSSRTVILPVLHCTGRDNAVQNARIAYDEGADGVFLINHAFHHEYLLPVAEAVAAYFPGFWLGVNRLGLPTELAFDGLPAWVSGVWADDAGLHPQQPLDRALSAQRKRLKSIWTGLYFGSVAFKTQEDVEMDKLASLAETATMFMDVVTTSGSRTGVPPDVDRIRELQAGILRGKSGAHLAIASGITPDNVQDYTALGVRCFLVATGISRDWNSLDPSKLRMLRKRAP